ncbi:hypothetical protein D3C86_1504400 [compost metagenome]
MLKFQHIIHLRQIGLEHFNLNAVLGAQLAGRLVQSLLITRHQQQIKTTRRQAFRINRANAGRSTGDEGRTLGLDRIHDCAPERCLKGKPSASFSRRLDGKLIYYRHNLTCI